MRPYIRPAFRSSEDDAAGGASRRFPSARSAPAAPELTFHGMGRSVRRVCTTLDIPDELMEEAQRLLGFKSKIHTVLVSLRESVRRHRVKEMMGLLGAIELDVDVPRSRRRPRTGQPRPRGRNA